MSIMKILHINCSESGSTGKIISDISEYVYAHGGSSVLCAPKVTSHSDEKLKKYQVSMPCEQGIYRRLSYISGIPYGFAPISTAKVFRIIRKEKPDIVHLHSINSSVVNVYRLLAFLKKKKIPTVVTNHAEFLYTGSCSHAEECNKWQNGCGSCPMLKKATGSKFFDRTHTAWKKMKRAFDGFENLVIVSVSEWVRARSASSPILNKYRNVAILNGVNARIFNLDGKSEKKEGTTKTVLHVTSSFNDNPNSIKGGVHFIELARRFENEDVNFLVAGPFNIKGEIPKNILLLGSISDQKRLAELYRNADLTVLTSKRETFGMAVAESMCCGTPVAGFMSGGSESVAISEFSQFVEFGNVDLLENILRTKWLNFKDGNNSFEIADEARAKYSSERMAEEYLDLYKELADKEKK